MARMLGRQRQSGCGNFGCRLCGPGDTRLAKRTEQRQVRREMSRRDPLPAPYADYSDCRHGCNGSEILSGYSSDTCDWQCHPGLEPDPERAARFEAMHESIVNS